MLDDIFKAMGPIVAAALADRIGGRNGAKFRFGEKEFRWDDSRWDGEELRGVALDELDLTQEPPSRVSLAGASALRIVESDVWRISATGPGAETLRFVLREGHLSILPPRHEGGSGAAPQIELAMPAPRALALSGSGRIEAEALAPDAKLAVFGSGRIAARGLACEKLKIAIAGSGAIHAAGRTDKLKLSLAGSGSADLAGLTAQSARIALTGSGKAVLASDGEVAVKLMGSGEVEIRGSARCTVRGMGSGKVQILPRGEDAASRAPAPSSGGSDDIPPTPFDT